MNLDNNYVNLWGCILGHTLLTVFVLLPCILCWIFKDGWFLTTYTGYVLAFYWVRKLIRRDTRKKAKKAAELLNSHQTN